MPTSPSAGTLANTPTLRLETVQRLERLLGGDPVVEDLVLRFIAARYQARSFLYLPPRVAEEIFKRPADFLRAAKQYAPTREGGGERYA